MATVSVAVVFFLSAVSQQFMVNVWVLQCLYYSTYIIYTYKIDIVVITIIRESDVYRPVPPSSLHSPSQETYRLPAVTRAWYVPGIISAENASPRNVTAVVRSSRRSRLHECYRPRSPGMIIAMT